MNKILLYVSVLFATSAHAALTIDRSRLILNEGERSVSINVENRSKQDPYLAQGWMEDINEEKSNNYITVLPPLQRVEAGGKTMVRLQPLPNVASWPQDRESVLFFNLREIPPKSSQSNVFSLALQSRIKVFYRPKAIAVDAMKDVLPGTEDITLTRRGDNYVINNPTPYYFSFVEARRELEGKAINEFVPIMVAPKSQDVVPLSIKALGSTPVMMYVNDYGSQRLLPFSCDKEVCKAEKVRLANKINVKVVLLDDEDK